MIKGKGINLATAKVKNKTLPLKIWENGWYRLVSCKYQSWSSVVPVIDQLTLKKDFC